MSPRLAPQIHNHLRGIAYATAEVMSKNFDNSLRFSGLTLKFNTGTVAGTNAYVANTHTEWLQVYIGKKLAIDLVGQAVAEAVPYPFQLLREMNRLANGVAESDEFINIRFPFTVPPNHNAYIRWKNRVVGELQTGTVADSLVGASFDLQMDVKDTQKRGAMMISNFDFLTTTLTGPLRYALNPTESGYKAVKLMVLIEDNATASDTAVARIYLKKGQEILQEGTVTDFRARTVSAHGIATSTGFVELPIMKPIGSNDLWLELNKTAAGTAVSARCLLVAMK